MVKRTQTYTDFNGVSRTEDAYFNFTPAELHEMEFGTTGGLSNVLQHIIDSKDYPSLIKWFKLIIKKSYGRKTLDGKGFEKSEEIFNEFAQTNAYSDLYMTLAMNDVEASKFINELIPSNMEEYKVHTTTSTNE